VKSEDDAKKIMDNIAEGSSFANLAQEFSTCPSGAQGGSLGTFNPGTMVAEFDQVVFSPETNIGEVVGPVQTKVRCYVFVFACLRMTYECLHACFTIGILQFGYHLIVVDKRTGV